MSDYGPEIIINDPAFIDPSVLIYGKVMVHEGVSLWPNTVIRAEMYEVEIGYRTNIQDLVMIHVGAGTGTRIGAHCSITHHATIHGARIGDNCLVGISATLMDGVVVGDNCIVAGGAFLKEGTVIPDNSIVMGIPGEVVRTRNNWVTNRLNAAIYHWNALAYARGEHRAWHGADFAAFSKTELARLEAEFAASQGAGAAAPGAG